MYICTLSQPHSDVARFTPRPSFFWLDSSCWLILTAAEAPPAVSVTWSRPITCTRAITWHMSITCRQRLAFQAVCNESKIFMRNLWYELHRCEHWSHLYMETDPRVGTVKLTHRYRRYLSTDCRSSRCCPRRGRRDSAWGACRGGARARPVCRRRTCRSRPGSGRSPSAHTRYDRLKYNTNTTW